MKYLYLLVFNIFLSSQGYCIENLTIDPPQKLSWISYTTDNTQVTNELLITNATSLLPPWSLEGSAEPITQGCLEGFQLTTTQTAIKGCAWDTEAIDFSSDDIDHTVMMNFGSLDANGADGICLVYKSSPDGCGVGGGGIGASGLPNSFIIEFDTWDNGAGLADIPDDHVAVSINGDLTAPIAGPISLGNIEDGLNHEVRFVWNAGSQTYEIYFDGSLKISGAYDIPSLFGGGLGYCGFTASTGGAFNNQSVFPGDETGPPPPPVFNNFDQEVCENQQGVAYSVIPEPGITYHWTAPADATIIGDGSSSVLINWGSQSGEVCVTADNGCGISAEVCIYVTVILLPDVEVIQPPVICDDHFDIAKVVLSGLLPTQTVSYHLTMKDAIAGTPIMNPTVVTMSGTYYVRIETTKECYIVLPIDVSLEVLQIEVIGPLPVCAPNTVNLPTDITVNDYYGNDIDFLRFYLTQASAVLGTPQMNNTTISQSGVFWVRAETIHGCFDVAQVNVVIQEKPEIEITLPAIKCLGDTLNLTSIIVKDTAGTVQDSLISSFYFSYADAQKDTNRIIPPVIWYSDTVWIRSKTTAGCYDIESVILQFLPAPVANISGSGIYCKSDSAVITIDFNGKAPFTASFTDGINTFNINQIANSYSIKIAVKSKQTYTLTSFTESSGATCPPVLEGIAQFDIYEEPKISFVVPAEACKDSLINIEMSSDKNWPVQLDYLFNNNPGSIAILNAGTNYSGVLSIPGTFIPLSIKDVNGCIYSLNDTFIIKVNTPPVVSNIQEKCMGTDFIVSFTITSSDPSSITINGSQAGLAGNQFTSPLLPSKTNYSFLIEDSNGCGPLLITGSKNCDCQTFAGTMQLTPLDICINSNQSAIHNGDQILDANDGLVFILHDSPGTNAGNIIAYNNQPIFSFDPTKMQAEKLYYISAMAANLIIPGQLDQTDPCLSISAGTPVIFHNLPTVSFASNDTICLGKEANLLLNISGNTPYLLHIFQDGLVFSNPSTISNSYLLKDSPTTDKLYSVWISDKFCDNTQLDSAFVHVNESPTVINIKHVCDPNNLSYTVSFDIIGGDPSSYKVSNIGGKLTGTSFTSDAIAVSQAYNIFVDDKFGCGPFIVAGAYSCKCETNAGVINNADIIACVGDTILIDHDGEYLDGNDQLEFIISKNANPDFTEIVYSSDKPLVWFDPSNMLIDVSYYVKMVAGNKLVSTNQVDPNDPCISYANIIGLIFKESPLFTIQSLDTLYTSCDQFKITLQSSPAYTAFNYINQWSTDVGNIIGPVKNSNIILDKNGTYSLSITDFQSGCTASGQFKINLKPEVPYIKQVPDMDIGCKIKQLYLDASGSSFAYPFEVSWSSINGNIISATDQLKLQIDEAGTYIIQIKNTLTGCIKTDTIIVSTVKGLEAKEINIKDPDCPNTASGNIEVINIEGGQQPYTYTLNNNIQNTTGLFDHLNNGAFNLNIKDINGCLFDTLLTLTDPEPLMIDLGPDITVEWGDLVQMNAQISVPFNEIDTLIWSTLDSASCNFCISPTYKAKQSNIIKAKVLKGGCIAKDDIRVIVEKTRNVYIPNIFSPNADGINDKLYIFGDSKVVKVKSFVIYDRWGEQVFEADDFVPDGQSGGWDGRFKDKYMNTQVVVYYALIQFIDGAVELYKGDVTVSR